MSATATAAPPPAAPPPPAGHRDGRRAVAALARVEGRRLVRHPATLTGLALSCFLVLMFQDVETMVLHRDVWMVQAAASPLIGGALIAAHLAAGRAARHGTDALFETLRAGRGRRTTAILIGGTAPAALSVVWASAALALLRAQGAIWAPEPADLLAIPALCLLAVGLGVALGRFVPTAVAGPMALVGVGVVELVVATRSGTWQRLALLSDWGPRFGGAPEVWPQAPWVHLAYVLAMTGLIAAVALARTGRRRARMVGASGLAVVTFLSGAALTRPVPEPTAERLARLVLEPERLSTVCEPAGTATICTPPAYTAWIDRWQPVVARILEMVPPAARPPDLRVEVGALSWDVPEPVGDVIEQRLGRHGPHRWPGSPPGTVRLGTRFYGAGARAVIATAVAREVVGLGGEVESHVADAVGGGMRAPCSARGQAREAVALYLAAVASPRLEGWLRGSLGNGSNYLDLRPTRDGGFSHSPDLWLEDGYFDPRTEIRWSRTGGLVALQLLDAPDQATVRERLADRWQHWTAAETGLEELTGAFALPGPPSVDELLRDAGVGDAQRELAAQSLTVGDGPVAPCP